MIACKAGQPILPPLICFLAQLRGHEGLALLAWNHTGEARCQLDS